MYIGRAKGYPRDIFSNPLAPIYVEPVWESVFSECNELVATTSKQRDGRTHRQAYIQSIQRWMSMYRLAEHRRVENLPEEIHSLIYGEGSRWSDLRDFAENYCKMKYSNVHSILARSSQKRLKLMRAISESCGLSLEDLASALLEKNQSKRERKIAEILGGRSWREFANCVDTTFHRLYPKDDETKVHPGTLFSLFQNLEHTQLRNKMLVISKLGLDLERFFEIYVP